MGQDRLAVQQASPALQLTCTECICIALVGCGKACTAAACMLHIAASIEYAELHDKPYDLMETRIWHLCEICIVRGLGTCCAGMLRRCCAMLCSACHALE